MLLLVIILSKSQKSLACRNFGWYISLCFNFFPKFQLDYKIKPLITIKLTEQRRKGEKKNVQKNMLVNYFAIIHQWNRSSGFCHFDHLVKKREKIWHILIGSNASITLIDWHLEPCKWVKSLKQEMWIKSQVQRHSSSLTTAKLTPHKYQLRRSMHLCDNAQCACRWL